uniref:Uncharacterized protein n=1 Tax=Arundo donax TaxID=35708 RepID=A0A0A9EE06_ARUDO
MFIHVQVPGMNFLDYRGQFRF